MGYSTARNAASNERSRDYIHFTRDASGQARCLLVGRPRGMPGQTDVDALSEAIAARKKSHKKTNDEAPFSRHLVKR